MGQDLADIQLLSKFNKVFRFLFWFIDIFSKYAWVIPLKDKKGINIVNAFQIILKESNRKPKKIWVDKGSDLATKTTLTTVENKIPSITGLVKKKHTTILRLLILKIFSIIIIMINMLLLQNLIL